MPFFLDTKTLCCRVDTTLLLCFCIFVLRHGKEERAKNLLRGNSTTTRGECRESDTLTLLLSLENTQTEMEKICANCEARCALTTVAVFFVCKIGQVRQISSFLHIFQEMKICLKISATQVGNIFPLRRRRLRSDENDF